MANPVWPASLPVFQSNVKETHQPGFIRTPMELGPTKTRRRFTATSRVLSGTMIMTAAQRVTFETFIDNSIGGGATGFQFVDQSDGGTYTWKLVSMPTFTAVTSDDNGVALWRVGITIERLN